MIERNITIAADDQAAVAQALAGSMLSRKLLIAAAIVLPLALIITGLLAMTDTVGIFVFGAVAALALVVVILLLIMRRVVKKAVATSMPDGSEFRVRAGEQGLEMTSHGTSSTASWASLSTVQRVKGAILVRNTEGKAAFAFPGRTLDDQDLATITEQVGR